MTEVTKRGKEQEKRDEGRWKMDEGRVKGRGKRTPVKSAPLVFWEAPVKWTSYFTG